MYIRNIRPLQIGERPRLPAEFWKKDGGIASISSCHGTNTSILDKPLPVGDLLLVLVLSLGNDLLHRPALSHGGWKVRFNTAGGAQSAAAVFILRLLKANRYTKANIYLQITA
jgi:hypothetical protein